MNLNDVMDGFNSRGFRGNKGKKMVAATGAVSTRLGKDYVSCSARKENVKFERLPGAKVNVGDAEQFVCSMLIVILIWVLFGLCYTTFNDGASRRNEESQLPQQVLEFPKSPECELATMNWRNVVKQMESFAQNRAELCPSGPADPNPIFAIHSIALFSELKELNTMRIGRQHEIDGIK